MSAGKVLILNCGASHVSYAAVSAKTGTLTLEEFHIQPLNYDYSSDEGWLGALAVATKSILSQAKNKGDVHLIAPGYQLLTKLIKVPHVEAGKQSQIIAFEAQQNIPYPLNEVVWDHQVIADDGVEAEVLLLAFKAVGASKFCSTISALGLKPVAVQASSIMDYNAYTQVYAGATEPTLLINIGARSSNLLFVHPEGFFARNIALGGNALTQSIAEGLGLSFVDAEQAKLGYCEGTIEYAEDDPALGVIYSAMEAWMKRMSQEITRSIVNFKRQKKGDPPSSILLNGRGSLIPGLSEQLMTTQKVHVEYFDPTQAFQVGPGVNGGLFSGHYFAVSEVLGEAARLLNPTAVGVNLIPGELAKKQEFAKKKLFLVLAAACLPLAPLPSLIHYLGAGGGYSEQADKFNRLSSDFSNKTILIEEALEKSAAIRDKVKDLDNLLKSQTNWISFFAELQDKLFNIQDVWLDKLEVVRTVRDAEGNEVAEPSVRDAEAIEKWDELLSEGKVHYELIIEGRILSRDKSTSKLLPDNNEAYNNLETFKDSIVESEFISGCSDVEYISDETFADAQVKPVLGFRYVLTVNPDRPL